MSKRRMPWFVIEEVDDMNGGTLIYQKPITRLIWNVRKNQPPLDYLDPFDNQKFNKIMDECFKSKYYNLVEAAIRLMDVGIFNDNDGLYKPGVEISEFAEFISANLRKMDMKQRIATLAVVCMSEFYLPDDSGYEIEAWGTAGATTPYIVKHVIPEVKKMLRKKQPFYISGLINDVVLLENGETLKFSRFCQCQIW